MSTKPGAGHKIVATKAALDTTISVDSLNILEEVMRHFYFKARILESLGDLADWKSVDAAMSEAGKWAEKVATFRHAKIAAIKLAGDPNAKALGELTLDQLKAGLIADLEKLADVIDLKALSDRLAIKRPN